MLLGTIAPALVKRNIYLLFRQANVDRIALPKELRDLYLRVGGLESTHEISYNIEEAWRSETNPKIRLKDYTTDDGRTGVVKRGKPKYPNRFKEKHKL